MQNSNGQESEMIDLLLAMQLATSDHDAALKQTAESQLEGTQGDWGGADTDASKLQSATKAGYDDEDLYDVLEPDGGSDELEEDNYLIIEPMDESNVCAAAAAAAAAAGAFPPGFQRCPPSSLPSGPRVCGAPALVMVAGAHHGRTVGSGWGDWRRTWGVDAAAIAAGLIHR